MTTKDRVLPGSIVPSLSQTDRILAIDEPWMDRAQSYIASMPPELLALEIEAARKSMKTPEEASAELPYALQGNTAFVSLSGPMSKRPSWMQLLFGGCSTVNVKAALSHALANTSAERIVLVIDSPGGTISGCSDLADFVSYAKRTKPVFAYVDDTCASAAYWVASQATAIWAGATSVVGSIGVYREIDDTSKMYEMAGIEANVVRSSPLKGAGQDGEPITKEFLAEWQREVDSVYALFKGAVKTGRNMTDEAIDSVADGRCWIGSESKDMGLVDGIGTIEDFLSAIGAGKAIPGPTAPAILPLDTCDGDDFSAEVHIELEGDSGNMTLDSIVAAVVRKLKPEAEVPETEAAVVPGNDKVDITVDEFNAAIADAKGEAIAALKAVEPLVAALTEAGISAPDYLKEQLSSAKMFREAVYSAYTTEYNRVFGSGSLSAADTETRLSGRSIEDIRSEVGEMARRADSDFTDKPEEGAEGGRKTLPEADTAGIDFEQMSSDQRKAANLLALRKAHGV